MSDQAVVRGNSAGGVRFLGESPVIVALRDTIARAAATSAKVLILGETGVGKDVVARLIHQQSPRRHLSFVAVNSGGLPETLLESELFGHVRGAFTGAVRDKSGLVQLADKGTLFLDELGEMSQRMQAILLRFLEAGEVRPVGSEVPTQTVNVRFVGATNRDLRQRVEEGLFREDLYYRLNVICIEIPPLRERHRDIVLLARHYLEEAARTEGFRVPELTPAAEDLLLGHRWPGNVRELRNLMERLVVRGYTRPILPDDCSQELQGRRPDVRVSATSSVGHAELPGSEDTRATMSDQSPVVEQVWARLRAGEDFWTVVGQTFRDHELRRTDLRAVIDRGLVETRGSYRDLLPLFNLPASDYKRFHAFLYHRQCNLPVAPYRERGARLSGIRPSLSKRDGSKRGSRTDAA